MRTREIKKRKNNAINLILCIILAWILASYIDVITHNMSTCDYAWWNAIGIFTQLF